MIDFDDLKNLLKEHKNIILFIDEDKDGEFNRKIRFEALGNYYVIEWWKNIGYLFIDGVQIPFHNCDINSNWPNNYKNNLNFYYRGEKTCILPIEEF